MKRRDFLALTAAVTTLPLTTAPITAFAATGAVAYAPGLVAKRLAAGETVFLDFKES